MLTSEQWLALGFTKRTDHFRYAKHFQLIGTVIEARYLAGEWTTVGWFDTSEKARAAYLAVELTLC